MAINPEVMFRMLLSVRNMIDAMLALIKADLPPGDQTDAQRAEQERVFGKVRQSGASADGGEAGPGHQ